VAQPPTDGFQTPNLRMYFGPQKTYLEHRTSGGIWKAHPNNPWKKMEVSSLQKYMAEITPKKKMEGNPRVFS